MSGLKFRFTSLFGQRLTEILGDSQKLLAPPDPDGPQSGKPVKSINQNASHRTNFPYLQWEADTRNYSVATGNGAGHRVRPSPQNLTRKSKPTERSTSTVTEPVGSGIPRAANEAFQQSQSSEWITDEWTTDDETLNWLEQELAKQNFSKGPGTFHTAAVHIRNKADPILWNEKPNRKLIGSGKNDETTIERGFGGFSIGPQYTVLDEKPRSFPPLPNAYYNLTTYGIDPKIHTRISKKIVVDKISSRAAETRREGPGRVACTFDENVSHLSSAHSNDDIEGCVSRDSHEFCAKCQNRHIRHGPPVTLDDRDTCRSMLPEWFPQDRFERPWDAFIELMNRYLRVCQILDGFEENPETKAAWKVEYHDPSPEWKAVGRFGGWWQCRIEPEEGGSIVPSVEMNCQICHRWKVDDDQLPARRGETLVERKKRIEGWIDMHMKQGMLKDRAYVRARIQTDGY